MDTDIFEVISKLGRVFAFTPPHRNDEKSQFSKKYSHFMFVLYTINMAVILYYRTYYNDIKYTVIQEMLTVSADAVAYLNLCHTVLVVGNTKTEEWLKLMRNLKQLEVGNSGTKPDYWILIFSNFVFISIVVLMGYLCVEYLGLNRLILNFCLCFEYYSQCFCLSVICVILKILLARYRHHRCLLSTHHKTRTTSSHVKFLKKFEQNLYRLRETADVFNDIFGWTILSSIFFFSLKNLIFLDAVIRDHGVFKEHSGGFVAVLVTLAQLLMLIMLWVGFLSISFLCDAVLHEYEEIFNIFCLMEISFKGLCVDAQDWYYFEKIVVHNLPRFTAARFFSISRSTVFGVLGSITTFLIVIIQFKID